ncbi:MAG: zf-HC2 domain-containing protein [Planctomycetota bacterium]
MTPLTLDCTVVQQQLGAYRDGELDADVAEGVAQHLAGCGECAQAQARLEAALVALKTLSGRDVDRLRAEATPFDPRPLTTLIGVGAVVLIGVLIALVVLAFRDAPAPSPAPPAPPEPAPRALVLPTVGAVVGIEEDLAWTPAARETAPAALPEPEPEPVAVAAAPAEAPAEPEAPVAVAEPDPEPMAAAPAPAKPKDAAKPEPLPLPDAVANALARWKVGEGLAYKGLEFYFVVDPSGRDRLGGGSLALVRAEEDRPARPDRLVLEAPRGARRYVGLVGELVEAPYGLRVLVASAPFRSDPAEVLPISFDGLTRRATPLLKGPLILPSVARKELIQGRRQEAVAELLQLLNDPSLLEFRRLRDELARLESDARELERRLRGLLASQRGLRGLGYSVSNEARALDLFPSATQLGAALPRLLRTALLEEALASAPERMPIDDLADSRPRTVTPGRTTTLQAHLGLLQLARQATAEPGSPRFTARVKGHACELRVERGELVHGASF